MTREQVCKKYLKDNDILLFEVNLVGELSKTQFIPITLINLVASILYDGCSNGMLEHSYILGVGKLNIYILDLGIQILKHKNIKPKKVQILDKKYINDVTINSGKIGIMNKITIQIQEEKKVFHANCNEISQSQVDYLSQLTNNL